LSVKWFVGAALLVCICPGWLAAQDQPAPRVSTGRVVTKTRLVALFSDLETQLLQGEQARDKPTLNRLLGEEFEVWTPNLSGDPIPRDDWQKRALAQKLSWFRIEQMAVKVMSDEVVVASFLLKETTQVDGKSKASNRFIVDVWKKNGDAWQLTDRYSSRVTGSADTESGKKPTGKE
jgi:Domain of unknown function (DUF4440)